MDNKKDQNILHGDEPIRWKSDSFLSNDDYLTFVFKKTEKIISALYLISGLIKDEDPMKWELRARGIDMLSASFSASSLLSGDRNVAIQSLFTASLEVISLLNIARISGLISEMNHAVVVKEIEYILDMLRDRLSKSAESAGYVLSESFFRTSGLFSTEFSGSNHASTSFSGEKSKSQTNPSQIVKDSPVPFSQGQTALGDKKNKRQKEIINLLKERSNLSVKDFTRVIKDCSEKTVQRELVELVERGIIKKEGERRWSRYSLK